MQAATIPPWIWLAGGIALGALVGFFVGYAIGRGRRRYQPVPLLVFPRVTDPPLILEVDGCRRTANNSDGPNVKEDREAGDDVPGKDQDEQTLLCLRSSRSGGLAG